MDPKRRRLLVMLVAAEAVILVAIVQVLLPGAGGSRARYAVASADEPAAPAGRRFVFTAGRVLSIDDDRSSYRIVPADPDHLREIVVEDTSRDPHAALRVTQHDDTVTVTRDGAAGGRTTWAFGPFVHIATEDPVVTIHVPAGIRIAVADAAGVDIRGHVGDVDVRTSNGCVTIARHTGAIDVHSSNGNVHIADSRSGRIAVETSNGRVAVENTRVGTIETHASNGRTTIRKLTFDGATPTATFVTDNGNVALGGTFPASGHYVASSSNGRIDFAPQQDAQLTIAARTSNGRVEVAYPGAVAVASDGDDDPSRTVRLGNGGGSVELTTSNSRITISRDGAS